MRIPRRVLAVAKVASKDTSKDTSRYAFNGVHLRRTGDTLRAAATDGRALLAVTWKHVDEPPLPGLEEAERPVKDYQAIVPTYAFRRAGAAVSRKDGMSSIVVDEPGTNGKVRIIAYDKADDTRTSIEAPVIDGKFPGLDEVIPKADAAKVRIAVDAYRLADLLLALVESVGDGDSAKVILEISESTHPIKIVRTCGDTEAVGVLMPIAL